MQSSWKLGCRDGKYIFPTSPQSLPYLGDQSLKARQDQEKGIWGSSSERISRAFWGFLKLFSGYLVLLLFLCLSFPSSLYFFFFPSSLLSFSLLGLPSPECLSHWPAHQLTEATLWLSMPKGKLIFYLPSLGLGYLVFECSFCQ